VHDGVFPARQTGPPATSGWEKGIRAAGKGEAAAGKAVQRAVRFQLNAFVAGMAGILAESGAKIKNLVFSGALGLRLTLD